jgi:hypothetical protein
MPYRVRGFFVAAAVRFLHCCAADRNIEKEFHVLDLNVARFADEHTLPMALALQSRIC